MDAPVTTFIQPTNWSGFHSSLTRLLPQIQQQSLTAMMGAFDGSDYPDPNPVANSNQSGLPREPIPPNQGRRQDPSVRHALSELHNLQQQQTSPIHA